MKINSSLLKTLRAEKNWSQEQLAEACMLSLRTIQRLENGGNASIESVRALAAVFDIAPGELIISEKDEAMTPLQAIERGLRGFADFSGTASRAEYWWFFLFILLLMAIATILHERAYQVIAVMLFLPIIAAGTRRLNDIERSGWWQLFFLVPFGQVIVFYLLAQAKDDHPPVANNLEAA